MKFFSFLPLDFLGNERGPYRKCPLLALLEEGFSISLSQLRLQPIFPPISQIFVPIWNYFTIEWSRGIYLCHLRLFLYLLNIQWQHIHVHQNHFKWMWIQHWTLVFYFGHQLFHLSLSFPNSLTFRLSARYVLPSAAKLPGVKRTSS